MYLNTVQAGEGARKKASRVGRGIGCGNGKTCGRGHKGQHSRSGGYHKVGFEGGQMPIQRRLPKVGFSSRKARITTELRLDTLDRLGIDEVSIDSLRKAGLITKKIKRVKVIAAGSISRAVTLKGLKATKAAAELIQKSGGKVEENNG